MDFLKFFLSLIIILVVVSALMQATITSRDTSNYHIESVEIDGMDCILIWSFSQTGITCDWRSGKVLENQ